MKTKATILTLVTFFSLIVTNVFSQAQNATCPTDVNYDGITSSGDASIVAANFGTCPSGSPCPTDINHDGITSSADLNQVLIKIGTRCNVGIFNVSGATYGSNYIDIPVSISSDNEIVSLDFALGFNESKLTFSTINTITSYPYFSPFWNVSTTDRKLRMTGFTSTHFDNDTVLITVRFTIASGATVSLSDFSGIDLYLNGNLKGFILK
ncbi:MAG TPA: cohesin domain-containing protein [Bacteroidia bacterium]|jgi:hypothetical protein|nr:cohesin domain-containing protein [Bacteroidia bacterium]